MEGNPRTRMVLVALLISSTGLLALVAAGAVFLLAVVRPLDSRRQAAVARCEQLDAMLRSSAKTLQARVALEATLAELKQRADSVRARVPAQPGEAELLGQLTQFADRLGVTVVDYQRGTITEAADHCELRVGLKCEGKFDSLCRLLHELQAWERIVIVEQLHLKSAAREDRYPVDLTLLIYFRPGTSSGSGNQEHGHG